MVHISEKVAAALVADGWARMGSPLAPQDFFKRIKGYEAAGSLSDGARQVHLEQDESGRWLSRVNGWGHIEKDVDLREFEDAEAAIAAVLAK